MVIQWNGYSRTRIVKSLYEILRPLEIIKWSQAVDKVDGMQTVENFERQGTAKSRLRSVFTYVT